MRNFPERWLLVTATLLLAAIACQLVPSSNQPGKAVDSGKIIFQDDFSDPSSGWNRAVTPNGVSDYNDGAYHIFVNQVFTDIWSMPGLMLDDISIEVDAIKVGGARDNRFGLICRSDGDRFYTFIISSDGFYGIGKTSAMDIILIGMPSMQSSDAIRTGTATNHLRADCTSNTLTLFINDQLVEQVQDGELVSGDVGLIAGTYEIPGTDILFDNFTVRSP